MPLVGRFAVFLFFGGVFWFEAGGPGLVAKLQDFRRKKQPHKRRSERCIFAVLCWLAKG